ncbi:MAG TPA: hypothetical protein VGX23_09630 [Actinocrinis sp.]|nr:hypothetical protein [Actinocrinis sp.]
MTATMPAVDGAVLADLLDALPPRLRKRLDSMAEKAAGWPLEVDGDLAPGGKATVVARVDDETRVTVQTRSGVVWSAEDVHCDCLLAPACLHRAALIALAPPMEAGALPEPGADPAADSGTSAPGSAAEPVAETATTAASGTSADQRQQAAAAGSSSAGTGGADRQPAAAQLTSTAQLTSAERAAARSLWNAGAALLLGGVIGASLFNEAQLRRVAHQARAIGLHRAAALGNRVASGLRAGRERRADYSLPQLTADLRDLLLLARALPRAAELGDADQLADLRGIARRGYDHQGGLRLYGLFTEPIIAGSGHAGVVTTMVDDNGVLWTTANVMPGDPSRVRPAYNTAVNLGGTVVTHRELTRGGLIVSGASASADGRLSGGSASRAVKAAGAQWTERPIAGLFDTPLDKQVERAFDAVDQGPDSGGRAGDDLLFAAVRVLGPTELGFAAAVRTGEIVYCVSVQAGYGLPYRGNLEALSTPGLCLRIVARLDPYRPATLRVLAASPDDAWDDEQPKQELALPAEWSRRINLGLDTLSRAAGEARTAHPATVPVPATSVAPEAELPSGPTDSDDSAPGHGASAPPDGTALHLVRHRIEQAVAGGRVVTANASTDRDVARLRRSALHTAADLMAGLTLAAPPRRDAFGRPRPDDGYLEAWLAAAHYEAVASQRLLLRRWLRA